MESRKRSACSLYDNTVDTDSACALPKENQMKESVTVEKVLGGKRKFAKHNGISAILGTYANALPHEISDGTLWYSRANRFANKVAALTGKRPQTVAAIIARLSPQIRWDLNKVAALEVAAESPSVACDSIFSDNVNRALTIAGEDSDEAIAAQVLPILPKYKRAKISRFYANIVAPDNAVAVTVDTWAAKIWIGERIDAPKLLITDSASARIRADYRSAATLVGILPQTLQAITWVAAHRIVTEKGQRSLFEVGLLHKI